MRTEYLREFLVAASTLSFTAAAKRLYMSQPKMSMHIAAMEDELGFKLFNREGALTLTREGELFYERASELLGTYDELVRTCRESAQTVASRLLFGEFSMVDMFPHHSMSCFRRAVSTMGSDPRFDVAVRPLDNAYTIAEVLERGELDASFRTCCMERCVPEVVDLPDGMSALPLEEDAMVALVRAGHPLTELSPDRVTPAAIAAYPVLLSGLPSMATYNSTRTDFFAAHDCRPHYRTRMTGTPSSFARPAEGSDEVVLVASSYGRRLGSLTASDGLALLKIAGTRAQSQFCLCFRTGDDSPAVRELVDLMRAGMSEGEVPAGE